MIRLEGVTKFFITHLGRHYVFRDVSFTIPDGMKVGVLGPNGAGKTTLVRLLSGVDTPSRGRIVRTGRISWPLGLTSGTQKAMTGAQNARFVSRVQGVTGQAIERNVDFVREFSELGDFFDMPVSTYSSGMRSRLNFALAMSFDFDTYIIDELSATGDKRFKQKSREFFANKRRTAGLVKVSHDLQELREECETGIVVGGGELYFFDDIEAAAAYYEAQGYAPPKTERRRDRRKQRQRGDEHESGAGQPATWGSTEHGSPEPSAANRADQKAATAEERHERRQAAREARRAARQRDKRPSKWMYQPSEEASSGKLVAEAPEHAALREFPPPAAANGQRTADWLPPVTGTAKADARTHYAPRAAETASRYSGAPNAGVRPAQFHRNEETHPQGDDLLRRIRSVGLMEAARNIQSELAAGPQGNDGPASRAGAPRPYLPPPMAPRRPPR
jgi:capsular polysaccharide transport system ATP-binding protein